MISIRLKLLLLRTELFSLNIKNYFYSLREKLN